MILSAILTISTTRGNLLLFRYPETPPIKPPSDYIVSNKSVLNKNFYLAKQVLSKTPEITHENTIEYFKQSQSHNQQKQAFWLNDSFFGYDPHTLSTMLSAKNLEKLQVRLNDLLFIGRVAGVKREEQEEMSLRRFQFCLVLSSDAGGEIEDLYREIVLKFSKALEFCEEQIEFVGREARIMQSLAERFADTNHFEDAMQVYLEESCLARNIRKVYNAANEGRNCIIDVGGILSVSIGIPRKFVGTIRPYHCLVLMEDCQQTLNQMQNPSDLVIDIINLINSSDFLMTLEAIQHQLKVTIGDVFECARNLVRWSKARLIPEIASKNVYVLSSHFKTENIDEIMSYAKEKFSAVDMPTFLQKLSLPRAFGACINLKENKLYFLHALLFLIRRGWIAQIETFYYLTIDPSILQIRKDRIEWVKNVFGEEVNLYLCERLLFYLDGQHDLHEIAYLEKILKKDVKNLIAKIKEFVVCVERPVDLI